MVAEGAHRPTVLRPIPVGRHVVPRRRRAWLTLTLVLAGALAGLCLLYLEQTSRVVELGYELTRLQRQRDAVALEAAALRYELAQRQSLAQVYELATREYGMVPLRRVESLEVARPVETPAAMPDTPVRPTWWQRLRDSVLGVGYAVADEAP